jgi:hypothetical protein
MKYRVYDNKTKQYLKDCLLDQDGGVIQIETVRYCISEHSPMESRINLKPLINVIIEESIETPDITGKEIYVGDKVEFSVTTESLSGQLRGTVILGGIITDCYPPKNIPDASYIFNWECINVNREKHCMDIEIIGNIHEESK